jgi:hypothetical protein
MINAMMAGFLWRRSSIEAKICAGETNKVFSRFVALKAPDVANVFTNPTRTIQVSDG